MITQIERSGLSARWETRKGSRGGCNLQCEVSWTRLLMLLFFLSFVLVVIGC